MDQDAAGPRSDFFHRTLELVEDGVSLILLKGEDEFLLLWLCSCRSLRPRED